MIGRDLSFAKLRNFTVLFVGIVITVSVVAANLITVLFVNVVATSTISTTVSLLERMLNW